MMTSAIQTVSRKREVEGLAKVTKETAESHRRSLAEIAGRLFCEKGLDGVGVAEISRAAGLTHGAIYSGFASKRELAVEALKASREQSRRRLENAAGPEPELTSLLRYYISPRHRDDRAACCPMLASASEAARQDDNYREAFAAMFLDFAGTIQAAIERGGAPDGRSRALAIAAGMIGAVAVARALDSEASDELLAAARARLEEVGQPERRKPGRQPRTCSAFSEET